MSPAIRVVTLPSCCASDRLTTCILLPTYSQQIDAETVESILSVGDLYHGYISVKGCPDVTIARNRLFNLALKSQYDWFVCLDADIAFTRADFKALMRVETSTDYAVSGAYYKKNERNEEVTHGLGFVRISRWLLEAIAKEFPALYEENGDTFQVFSYTARTEAGKMLRSDSSFWFLCWQLGVVPRIYRSPTILHYGRIGFSS